MNAPDVLIAAHNEAGTIGAIIDAARASEAVSRVVVVADACADATVGAALDAGASTVLRVTNRDKGSTLAAGLRWVEQADVLLLDADLAGLTPAHVYALATRDPLDGMVVGLRHGKWLAGPVPSLSGERRLPTDVLRQVQLRGAGWAAETRINATVGRLGLPWRHVLLRGVTNPTKALAHPVALAGELVEVAAATAGNLGGLVAYATHPNGRTLPAH